jgi:phytoene synthase
MPRDDAELREADDRACRMILAAGSKSFAMASRLLPARVRPPTAGLYAFCRVADDAIDDGDAPDRALVELGALLDRVYAERPGDDPVERALCRAVHEHGIARPVLDALLAGFASDARGARIEDLDALLEYAVEVASSVGVAMTLVMGVRDRGTLARASDLGVAMQLTNIARDVGEDARRGRVYLPTRWFADVGLDRDAWLAAPVMRPEVASMVERALQLADLFYARAELGIAGLPADCRPAIRAASWIYADIGRVIRARGFDSVNGRARTSVWRKLLLALRARLGAAAPAIAAGPGAPVPPIALAGALVDACVGPR